MPKKDKLKYQIVIQWSDEDDSFLVGFPDFPGQRWRTHGDTYELALTLPGLKTRGFLIE